MVKFYAQTYPVEENSKPLSLFSKS